MGRSQLSIGLIETHGMIAAINAADAMCKAAGVTVAGCKKIGSGMVTVYVEGEVGAVQVAIESGIAAANKVSRVISSLIIARPEQSVVEQLNELGRRKKPKQISRSRTASLVVKQDTANTTPVSPAQTALVVANTQTASQSTVKVKAASKAKPLAKAKNAAPAKSSSKTKSSSMAKTALNINVTGGDKNSTPTVINAVEKTVGDTKPATE